MNQSQAIRKAPVANDISADTLLVVFMLFSMLTQPMGPLKCLPTLGALECPRADVLLPHMS